MPSLPRKWMVICKTDEGQYVQATRTLFLTSEEASEYAKGVHKARLPLIVEVADQDEWRQYGLSHARSHEELREWADARIAELEAALTEVRTFLDHVPTHHEPTRTATYSPILRARLFETLDRVVPVPVTLSLDS